MSESTSTTRRKSFLRAWIALLIALGFAALSASCSATGTVTGAKEGQQSPQPTTSNGGQDATSPVQEIVTPGMGLNGIPSFRHVFLVVMENKGYSEIIGSKDAPYINKLANTYGLAT